MLSGEDLFGVTDTRGRGRRGQAKGRVAVRRGGGETLGLSGTTGRMERMSIGEKKSTRRTLREGLVCTLLFI